MSEETCSDRHRSPPATGCLEALLPFDGSSHNPGVSAFQWAGFGPTSNFQVASESRYSITLNLLDEVEPSQPLQALNQVPKPWSQITLPQPSPWPSISRWLGQCVLPTPLSPRVGLVIRSTVWKEDSESQRPGLKFHQLAFGQRPRRPFLNLHVSSRCPCESRATFWKRGFP